MFGEEILMEIDTTLNRLIQNAEMIQNNLVEELSEEELDAFKKTQESLLNHLIYMDQRLEEKRNQLKTIHPKSAQSLIQQKRIKFTALQSQYTKEIQKRAIKTKHRFLSKRKHKRFLTV